MQVPIPRRAWLVAAGLGLLPTAVQAAWMPSAIPCEAVAALPSHPPQASGLLAGAFVLAGSGGGGSGTQGALDPAASRTSSPGGRQGRTFRHPVGFSFWYPQDWKATVNEGFLQLTPPRPGTAAGSPTELYFVMGESVTADGIATPDDPRVVESLDRQVRSLAPVLQYTGRSTPVQTTQGRAVLLEWQGTGDKGVQLAARAYVNIVGGYGVTLLGVGHRSAIDPRDADLRRIFASFGLGQGQNDPSLVGRWALVRTASITNPSVWETDWSRAQAVSERSVTLAFQPDGTCTRRNQSHMIVGAGDVWLEDKTDETTSGTWNAGDGILFVLWEDNRYLECEYRLEPTGRSVHLRMVCDKNGEVWERQ